MNLLLDENLSPRLVQRLGSLFPGLLHARDAGLKHAADDAIWNWARANRYTIITTDSDFTWLSERLGWPPKVVHLQECAYPLRTIEELLRRHAIRIAEFEKDSLAGRSSFLSATSTIPLDGDVGTVPRENYIL